MPKDINKEIFRPFSIRHKRALIEKKIRPSLSKRLCSRIWYILDDSDYTIHVYPDPNDNWNEQTTILAELPHKLLKIYGTDKLEAFVDDSGTRKEVDLKGFVLGAYPAQVLDVIEMVHFDLESEFQVNLQREINQVMRDGNCPWVLCDGQFVQMDSKFFEDEVLARANELLIISQFEGAKQEFLDARTAFSAENYKETIRNACNAFESVMKSILKCSNGSAGELIKKLTAIHFFSNLPKSINNDGFKKNVLFSLPYLGNHLGRHGQGGEQVEVPKHFAKLALHLAGSLIVFLVEHNLELMVQEIDNEETNEETAVDFDDIPF